MTLRPPPSGGRSAAAAANGHASFFLAGMELASHPPPSLGWSAATAASGLASSSLARNGALPVALLLLPRGDAKRFTAPSLRYGARPPVASRPPTLQGQTAAAAASDLVASSLTGTERCRCRMWPRILPPNEKRSAAVAASGLTSSSLAGTERGRCHQLPRVLLPRGDGGRRPPPVASCPPPSRGQRTAVAA